MLRSRDETLISGKGCRSTSAGSGTGFRTINNAHKPACTSAKRRTYYPQYMQQLFDLDLGKLLICTNPAKRTWVDAMGTVCP